MKKGTTYDLIKKECGESYVNGLYTFTNYHQDTHLVSRLGLIWSWILGVLHFQTEIWMVTDYKIRYQHKILYLKNKSTSVLQDPTQRL